MPVPINDFDNQALNQLPFRQRKPKWEAMAKAIVSQIKRMYRIFTGYMNGESFSAYNPVTPYAAGNCVQYNFKTWESLIDGNVGNTPDISPSAWILRNSYFIGATERTKYNGRYITLTYALNRYFQTTFRQPPYPAPYDNGLGGGTFSDIYITNVAPAFNSFVVSTDDTPSSHVGTTGSTGLVSTVEIYTAASSYEFDINIPIAVFNALGADDPIRESIVRNFADRYVVSSTQYNVVTY